jgi:hypothetical protein
VPLDPWPFTRVGREVARRPFHVQLLFCWTLGAFWIATGLVGHTMVWAVVLGVLFLIIPFVTLARRHRRQ